MFSRPDGRQTCVSVITVLFATTALHAQTTQPATQPATRPDLQVPADFPRFVVPGLEKEMASLRELYWLHYKTGGPLATIWDEWLAGPTLWPAIQTGNAMQTMRQRWRTTLSQRVMDADGYVSTHQHPSIAHQHGWPFPFWAQAGVGAWGWHFGFGNISQPWHGSEKKTQEGWIVTHGQDAGIKDEIWNIQLTEPGTTAQPPPVNIDVLQAPFMQLRWMGTNSGNAQPYLEWITAEAPVFSADCRFYFPPVESNTVMITMIPVFKHPQWKGQITGLRINFGNTQAGGSVGVQSIFTQYDTRHTVNNSAFVHGCTDYFHWTRDINFLRDQIQRMRLALRYMLIELRGLQEKCIVATYVGHDGRSGVEWTPDGKKIIHPGRGLGHNYWDLLPMGHKDAYGTIWYYDALKCMSQLEREIAAHPEWNMPDGPLKLESERLDRHAREVQEMAGKEFWNPETKRFTSGKDVDGKSYDFGFTFLNLEAIHYGLATPEQAKDIMSWISGERVVEGDTSQGPDIYHWRFAPRSTTRRNISYYGWFWSGPEAIPWGNQVQDGGAVLGFSYHDLMARLKTRGPDDAWARLKVIADWFDEVQNGGGYREYYKDGTRGTLQGGGPAGGLGLDNEFFESILVPQIIMDGFIGFQPTANGCRIAPNMPKTWPEITIAGVHLHELVLKLKVTNTSITITKQGSTDSPFHIIVPPGTWAVRYLNASGEAIRTQDLPPAEADVDIVANWIDGETIELVKK